ncbi:MAG TPA: LCP family protein, partial [Candidatus Saccharimonadales bacterium]|nr:LCP family protein [Candidatus Saccharimonadales bacterium]
PKFVPTAEAARYNPYQTAYSSVRGEKKRPKARRKWSVKKKIIMTVLAFLLIGFSIGAWYGTKIIGSLDKAFHGNIFSDVHALFSSTTLNGEAQGRVNILLAGNSADDPGHNGAQLTDSIMVLSINTRNHTAFMLSIPRDLWVYVPGFNSYQKINAAGEVSMNQLQQVVETDLGVPIDYNALIDYGAFRDAVNAVGGITINIQSPDPRGLYDAFTHLKLPNGENTLNGQQALDLARARGDGTAGDISYGFPGTDFTRTMYQRTMAIAVAKKALTAGVLTNPIKISNLVSAIGNNVKTNMNLQDVLRLAQIVKSLNLNNIGSYTYPSTTTGTPKAQAIITSYIDPSSGQDALAPTAGVGEYGQLQNYYQQLTSNNPVVKEDASVVVLNATNVQGLAKKDEGILQANKIDNVTVGDAYNEYPTSMIIDLSNGQQPATKALLESLFPGNVVNSEYGSTEAKEATNYNADFVVVLGQNSVNVKQP